MRLINLVAPSPLESMVSVLDRLGEKNYYEEASWFRALLPPPVRPAPNHLRDRDQYRELGDLTGLSMEHLYRLTVHRFSTRYYLPEQLDESAPTELDAPLWPEDRAGQAAMRDYLLGQSDAKVCPECWRDTGAVQITWSLRHVTTCPLHEVLLVDQCSACGEALRWAGGREGIMGRCALCGSDVGQFPTVSVARHDLSLELTQLIWSALGLSAAVQNRALVDPGIDALADPTAFPPAGPQLAQDHPLRAMHPATLLDFLRRMPTLLLGRDAQSPVFDPAETLPSAVQSAWTGAPRHIELKWQASVSVMHGALVAMWGLLKDWPAAWHQTLARIAHLESTKRQAGQKFPQRLAEEFPGPRWAWLVAGLEDYLGREALNNRDLYPWLGYYREAQRRPAAALTPLLSHEEAARALGVSEGRLRGFIARGRLRTTPSPGTGSRREWALIDEQSLKMLLEDRASVLSMAQASQYLGIGEEATASLVGAGLVPAESGPGADGGSNWEFRLAAIEEAVGALLAPVQPRPVADAAESPDTLDVGDAMRIASWQGVRLPALLLEVRSGALQAYREPEAMGLRQLWFERRTVLSWLARRRQPEGRELLTVEQVREMLSCKPETLRRLYAAGLLVPAEEKLVRQQTHWRYDPADVEAFSIRYVTTEAAAEILGVTQLTVQKWTREGRIAAVTGPHIAGSHTYRYDRAALEEWRRERLTFGEAMQALGVSKATLHRWVEQGKIAPFEHMGGAQRWFARADVERLRGS